MQPEIPFKSSTHSVFFTKDIEIRLTLNSCHNRVNILWGLWSPVNSVVPHAQSPFYLTYGQKIHRIMREIYH